MKKSKYDLTGKKFERLTVIRYIPAEEREGHSIKKDNRRWLCKCDCGNFVRLRTEQILKGKAKSCGCYIKDIFRNQTIKNTTHGLKKTRLYRIWNNMKDRCCNENCKDYFKYGGRGIKVCKEWRDDFQVFYDWSINNGYTDDLSIDRINVNGNYEPSNCRWTTNKIQCRNRTNNLLLEYKGKTKSLAEWCEELNLDYHLMHDRICNNWSVERAFETPKKIMRRKRE